MYAEGLLTIKCKGKGKEIGMEGKRNDGAGRNETRQKKEGKEWEWKKMEKGRKKEGSKRMEQDRTEKARKGSGRVG